MPKLTIFLKINEGCSLFTVLIKTKLTTGIKNKKTAGLFEDGTLITSKMETTLVDSSWIIVTSIAKAEYENKLRPRTKVKADKTKILFKYKRHQKYNLHYDTFQ